MATEPHYILNAQEARDALRLDETSDEREIMDYVARATSELDGVCDFRWENQTPIDPDAKTACRVILINDFYRGSPDYDLEDVCERWKKRMRAKASLIKKEGKP